MVVELSGGLASIRCWDQSKRKELVSRLQEKSDEMKSGCTAQVHVLSQVPESEGTVP